MLGKIFGVNRSLTYRWIRILRKAGVKYNSTFPIYDFISHEKQLEAIAVLREMGASLKDLAFLFATSSDENFEKFVSEYPSGQKQDLFCLIELLNGRSQLAKLRFLKI